MIQKNFEEHLIHTLMSWVFWWEKMLRSAASADHQLHPEWSVSWVYLKAKDWGLLSTVRNHKYQLNFKWSYWKETEVLPTHHLWRRVTSQEKKRWRKIIFSLELLSHDKIPRVGNTATNCFHLQFNFLHQSLSQLNI